MVNIIKNVPGKNHNTIGLEPDRCSNTEPRATQQTELNPHPGD